MKFTIKRSIWLRGEDSRASFLLRGSDEKMCCLGIFMESLGADREELLWRRLPSDLLDPDLYLKNKPSWAARSSTFPEWLVGEDHEIIEAFVAVNDNEDLPNEEREQVLTAMFAEQGVEVIFED